MVECRYGPVFPRICLALASAVLLAAVPQSHAMAAPDSHRPAPTTESRHRASGPTGALARLLTSDMSLPSERMPQGVPSWYDWAGAPRAHSLALFHAFRAFTSWGQLYQCAGTHPTRGESVELRDLQTWVLLRGAHRWQRIQLSSDLEGAAFAEDYHGPILGARYLPTPTETTVQPLSGHNFHFWPGSGRVSLRASQVVGVLVAVRARLRRSKTTENATPCLVLSVGGDMWRSLNAQVVAGASGDVGIGRFKRVERRWRLFTMTTASPALLKQFQLPQIATAGADF
jgi:hypothetical protein